MTVIHVNFKYGFARKPDDGKNCRNCAHCNDGPTATTVCLNCIRFGHTEGIVDNWTPQGERHDTTAE